jgi:syntaxin 16
MLLVSFNTDDSAQAQVEALTREMQAGFKKLNAEINNMEQTPGADDAEVRQQVQRQLAKALMVLTMEFRKEETRFLNKVTGMCFLCHGGESTMSMGTRTDFKNVESGILML